MRLFFCAAWKLQAVPTGSCVRFQHHWIEFVETRSILVVSSLTWGCNYTIITYGPSTSRIRKHVKKKQLHRLHLTYFFTMFYFWIMNKKILKCDFLGWFSQSNKHKNKHEPHTTHDTYEESKTWAIWLMLLLEIGKYPTRCSVLQASFAFEIRTRN